jgi:hypothetical protein
MLTIQVGAYKPALSVATPPPAGNMSMSYRPRVQKLITRNHNGETQVTVPTASV